MWCLCCWHKRTHGVDIEAVEVLLALIRCTWHLGVGCVCVTLQENESTATNLSGTKKILVSEEKFRGPKFGPRKSKYSGTKILVPVGHLQGPN